VKEVITTLSQYVCSLLLPLAIILSSRAGTQWTGAGRFVGTFITGVLDGTAQEARVGLARKAHQKKWWTSRGASFGSSDGEFKDCAAVG
jgi:hypothetical protein